MINEKAKDELIGSLLRFCDTLTISEQIKSSESLEEIHLRADLLLRNIGKLTKKDLEFIFEGWKDNFKCDICWYAGTFALRYNSYEDELLKLLEAIHDDDLNENCTLDLTLDKSNFVRSEYEEVPHTQVFLYIFGDNVSKFLEGGLRDIEEIFDNASSKTLIIVLDTDVCASGDYVAFIGGRYIEDRWAEILPKKAPDIELLQRIIEIREEETNWVHVDTKLTPPHFYTEHVGEISIIDDSADTLFLNLTILYLANKVKSIDEFMLATFEGMGKVDVKLSNSRARKKQENLRYLKNMFLWAYGENTSDKLSFIRNVVSSNLGTDPTKNYEMFVERAEYISNAVKSSYKIYLSRTIEKYFRIRKEALDYASSMSQQFSKQISEIIGSLVNSMLGAVVAVIGTLLSYLIKPEFSLLALNYGLKLYAIYVLIFPCGYVMLHAFSEYRVLKNDFEDRDSQFSDFMDDGDMEKTMRFPLSRRKKQFEFWFLLTLLIYVCVTISLWILPSIIVQWAGS